MSKFRGRARRLVVVWATVFHAAASHALQLTGLEKKTTPTSLHGRTTQTRCFLNRNNEQVSRRSFWIDVLTKSSTMVALLGGGADAAVAAKGYPQEKSDKERILKGYDRLTYLLDNWVKETTICGSGSDNPYIGCERNPMKVMEYLGYKSMDDPLFKADKTLLRLQALVPPDDEAAYLEAVEKWIENADEGSGMAYVSSWGEANPGGGKDRVEYFIERSKNDVIEARNSLETVIRILQLKQ